MRKEAIIVLALIILFPIPKIQGQNKYELLFVKNKFKSIIDIADRNIESNKAKSSDYYWKALVLNKQGQANKSVLVLEKGEQLFPESTELKKLLANTYYEVGSYKKAKPLLEEFSNDRDSKIKLAKIHEFSNNYSGAIKLLQELYEKDTTNAFFLKSLGDIHYKKDQISKAIECYSKALTYNPCDQPAAYRLSRIYLKENEFKSAVEVCEPILANDSLNMKFLRQKAYGYFKWRKYRKSSKIFNDVLSLGDSSMFVLKRLGISLINCDDFRHGREHLLKTYARDSMDYEICFFLGKSYFNTTRREMGIYFLNKADALVQPNPKVLEAINKEKALLFDVLRRYDEAISAYETSYSHSLNAEYLFHIASIYRNRKKDKVNALKSYERFLRELPSRERPKQDENKGQIIISLRVIAESNVRKLKEELFFEGKLEEN